MSDLLVAVVGVPILGALVPLVLARFRPHVGWPVAVVTMVLQAAVVLSILRAVLDDGQIATTVGDVPAALGIELVADGLSLVFLLLVTVVALSLLVYTRLGGPRSGPFYSVYLLLVAGLSGVCVTGDAFNLYVFLEIGGLSAYALVAKSAGGRAALASLQYLFLGTVGATFYLLGVGYLYVATGALNMADIAARLGPSGYESPLVLAAFAFVLVGLALKVALVPLHTWLPGAHSEAPVAVSVLLSGVVTAVAAYAVVRFALTVFTPGFFDAVPIATTAILVAAGASVLYGGYAAIRESAVKRVLAYSTVAQVGLAMLGVGLLSSRSLTGTVIHLFGHGVMKGGLFLAAGCLATGYGAKRVEDYAGLARQEPVVAGSFAVLALGMVGIPPTVGLLGKWYIGLAAVETGAWVVATLVFVSTLLSLAVFAPILTRLYLEPRGDCEPSGTVSVGMRGVAAVAAVTALLMGFAGPVFAEILLPVLTEVA